MTPATFRRPPVGPPYVTCVAFGYVHAFGFDEAWRRSFLTEAAATLWEAAWTAPPTPSPATRKRRKRKALL